MKKLFNRITPAVRHLFIVNIGVYILLILFAILFRTDLNDFIGAYPHSSDNFNIVAIFTYMFSHTFNISHIFFNMLLFLIFAPNFENRFGYKITIISYVFFGLMSYLIFTINANGIDSPLVGASGSIMGFLSVYLIQNIFKLKKIGYNLFVIIMLMGMLLGLFDTDIRMKLTECAHIGGFIGGLIFYTYIKIKKPHL